MKTTIRLPDWLHVKIKELAEEENRSFQGQVVYMLRKYLEWRRKWFPHWEEEE